MENETKEEYENKDPAFLFYSSDFLTGTMFMSDAQLGKYIKILCTQHQKGHLSEKDMLKICKRYDKDIFEKFKKDSDGNYYNIRLEKEITKRRDYSKSRASNRKNKVTFENICFSYVKHMENENENININNTSFINSYIKNNKLDNIINLLLEYFNYRKSIKIPNNQNIIDELILFLKPYNVKEQEQIIKTSLKNGYREFYPPRKENNDKKEGVIYETI
jgi:hypothetical protein